jgi:hypothetical protein
MELSGTVVAAAAGLLAGVVGSLVAPWVRWGVEKRKLRRQYRLDLIVAWRGLAGVEEFDRRLLINNSLYGPLRPLLSPKAIEQLERSGRHILVATSIRDPDRSCLLQEIARIEKEWGLL